MCLIIVNKPNSQRETFETFESIYKINNDGLGIAYMQDNQLFIRKDFDKDLKAFHEFYSLIPAGCPILVHFRKCSSGHIIPENLHPFSINDNVCFAFNGTISDLDFKGEHSDTYVFNNIILRKILAGDIEAYTTWWFKKLIERYINSSKMVILDNKGEFYIFNESLGHWNEEKTVWHSNKIWMPAPLKQKTAYLPSQSFSRTKKTFKYQGPIQEVVAHRMSEMSLLGDLDSIKKKYVLWDDPYSRELSISQLVWLYKKHHKGIKKLIRKYIIRELETVPDQIRLTARLKYSHDLENEKLEYVEVFDHEITQKELDLNPEKLKLDNDGQPLLLLPPSNPNVLNTSIGEILAEQMNKETEK